MSTVDVTTSLPGLEPDLDRARELAERANVVPVRYRFIDDLETPVSAFLRLRGDGPAFLLESAEQGRLGRWSFLGFRPRSILRWSDGRLSEWAGESAAESGTGAAPDRVTGAAMKSRSPINCRPSRAAPSASSATTWCAPWSPWANPTRIRSGCPTWR
jgi:Anthranilate synthase component I, N terminal region